MVAFLFMAKPKLGYAIGNGSSTTSSSSITNSDTTIPLTSTTAFQAKSGEGMILISEGEASEEIAYSTGLSGSDLAIPLANRGLEGGSAQAQSSGASIKGILTAGMWNDMIDSLLNDRTQSTGALDGTKVMKVTSSDGQLPTSTGNIQLNGSDPKRSFYVPAAGMYGATTNGAATGQIESATNKINTKVLDFDGATEEYAWFCLPSPDYWDLSTITLKFHWTTASGSGDVIWGAASLARSDDDALDTALGSAVTVTDTVLSTNDLHTTSATSAITVGGTPAKGDYLFVRVYRDADAGGDTLNGVDARLIGVTVKFTVGQYDDQ